MRSEPFEFQNTQGLMLAGRLDRPDGVARAYALFAHCFTCDKSSKAAVHISRALAGLGVAVLRFDFTGLGDSEGEFAATGFSSNVADLVAAASNMAGKGAAPALLIGHSLGGAAMLAAASDIVSAKAVVTIGAPADPAHVLGLLGDGVRTIERDGQAEVSIGGRAFLLRKSFVDDIRLQALKDRVSHLGRALLIMHAPLDAVVGIENASAIFLAARHPKSFVSLDKADHLLTRAGDAEYAAGVIAAWAARYVEVQPDAAPDADDGVVRVEETGAGAFQVQASVRGERFFVDEPADVGGLGTGPSPYELIAAGLGACTAMTIRLYARQKGWPLERVHLAVRHEKAPGQTPADTFHRAIALDGALDNAQRAKLLEIAGKCPVHRTLEGGARVLTEARDRVVEHDPNAAQTDADEHFRAMDAACRDGT